MADQHYRNVAALGEAIRAYLAAHADPAILKSWFEVNKDMALDLAFDTDVYFDGTGFLPDAARFPMLIAVYMRHSQLINETPLGRAKPLPTVRELMSEC